jgi:hypothetical protein
MRWKCIAVTVPALFVSIVAATDASARHVFTLSGTYSRSQVKKDCDAAGGAYQIDGGGYFCVNPSNGNSVNCNNRGKCTGSIPRQSKPPRTIGGILHPPSAALRSSGNSAPPQGHRPPARVGGFKTPSGVGRNRQPIITMRGEAHYSGGHHR